MALNEEKGIGKGGRGGVHYGIDVNGVRERGYPWKCAKDSSFIPRGSARLQKLNAAR